MLSGCTALIVAAAEWIRPFRAALASCLLLFVMGLVANGPFSSSLMAQPVAGNGVPPAAPTVQPGPAATGSGIGATDSVPGVVPPGTPTTGGTTGVSGGGVEVGPRPAAIVLPDETDPLDQQVPPYYVAPLRMTGYVEDATTARLEVIVEVRVSRNDGWYEVPLRMNQAHVLSLDYEGPRTPVPADSGDRDEGLRWKFRGEGTHRLKLDLRVPLKRSPAGTQLLLSLPETSRYFPTQLTLQVPGRQLILRKPDDTTLTQSPQKTRMTQLNATVLGSRIDITWLEQQENQADVSRVQTSITISREFDRLQLQAVQDIVLDSSAAELLVQLPTGFSLSGPQPIRGSAYVSHELSTTDPGMVRVLLAEGSTGDIRLEWTLDSEFDDERAEVLIDGFIVKDAKRQSGTIAVARTRGYRVMRHLTDNNENVQRTSTTGVRSTAPVVATAFQFLHQPFSLLLDYQKVKPSLTCRPRWTLMLSEDRVDLRCITDVRVEAGVVEELVLHWPGQQGVAWTIENFPPQVVDVRPKVGEKDQWQVILREPMDGQFALEFNFSRPLSREELPIFLPALDVDRMLPGLLELVGGENVEPTLQFAEGEAIELIDAGSVPLLAWGATEINPRSRYYRIKDVANLNGAVRENGVLVATDLPAKLTATVTVHEREVLASSIVTVSDIESTSVVVEQQIPVNVRYGRLNSLRFRMSQELRGTILQGAEGTSIQCRLNGEPSLVVGEEDGWLKTEFQSPISGRFVLSLRYRLNRASDRNLSIPIFECREAAYATTDVRFLRTSGLRVSTSDEHWAPVHTDPDAVTWHSPQTESEFVATIESGVGGSSTGYEVQSALVRAFFEENGRQVIVADYQLDRSPRDILLQLPSEASSVEFHWNGNIVGDVSMNDAPGTDGQKQYRLGVGVVAREGAGWLTVRYLLQGPAKSGLTPRWSVSFPRFPQEVYVSQAALEISLPDSSYLFSYPFGLSPQLVWKRTPFYERVVDPLYLASRPQRIAPQWRDNSNIGDFPENGQKFAGPTYTFVGLGAMERVEFRSIGLGSLLFLGSFVTLTVACLLWTIAATRQIMTLFVLLLAIAVASLVAPESVAVLLQPGLLGLSLAVVGIWVHMRSAKPLPVATDPVSHRSFDAHRTTMQRPAEDPVDMADVSVTEYRPAATIDTGSRP
ncbi:MAG: hypothetical protein R3C01_15255 [Planctomycetaceae bacterium]